MYLSRNYKVACPTASVFAQPNQESPLIRRFHSFPARERYKYILLWVHAMSSRIYIILCTYTYTLKSSNSYYTMCILILQGDFFIFDRNITSYVLQYIFKYKRCFFNSFPSILYRFIK